MPRLGRRYEEGVSQQVATLELFYDLVFVFAISQVSHLLLDDLSWIGAGQAMLALMVVWWAWNYTTWVTNELDPDSTAVKLLMVALMLASLVMAVAIPDAFGDRALLFVGAYLFIQIGRHLFLTFVAAGPKSLERARAAQILTWFAIAGIFWVAGALSEGSTRTLLWLVALACDYGAPSHTFWLPGVKRVTMQAWNVTTAHFSERFQLFIIIALGESIVLTGATMVDVPTDLEHVTAFAIAFLMTAAFWWLYFDHVAERAEHQLEAAANRTAMARDAYTYLHVVIVASIILSAVGDELIIAHPGEPLEGAKMVAVVAGPALFLAGHSLFRLRTLGSVSLKRLAAILACGLLGLVGGGLSALAISAILLAILALVIVIEQLEDDHRHQAAA
jgi:low temperature requirement protein LtrA